MRAVWGRIFTAMLVWNSANAIAWVWKGVASSSMPSNLFNRVGPGAVRGRVRSTADRCACRIESFEATIGGRAT
jgi:hypothetical protein